MKLTRHLKRALALIFLALIAGNAGRLAMVPESFGKYGDFRANHLNEERAREPMHVGTEACGLCHEERLTEKDAGAHASIPCENCHFQPYAGSETRYSAHPKVSNPPNRSQHMCRVCHQLLDARPKDFPQVADFKEHILVNRAKLKVKEPNQPDENSPCIQCHNPHSPKITVAKNG